MTTTAVHADHAPAGNHLRPANELAMNTTGRPYISYSQVSLMRSCPRKFQQTYVEQAPRDFIPSSLIFGGSIHTTVETFNRGLLEGPTCSRDELLTIFHQQWNDEQKRSPEVPVRYGKTETAESLQDLAGRMIDSFLASPLASPKGTILGVEEQLTVELDPDLPDLLARVDLVTRTDGALHIIDFKTARSRWSDQKAAESAEQLILYGNSLQSMSRNLGLPVKLHFAVLTKAKKPVVQVLSVPADGQRLAGLTESVRQVWQAIQAGHFYPSPSRINCSTCPYKSRCPAFAGG